MTASQLIPQYHLVRDVDATHLLAEKDAQASRGGAKVGVNDLLIQAIAETAVRHPLLATGYVDDDPPYLLRRESIDVGLAVATDRGLVVPIIRAAHEQGLAGIASDRQAARRGRPHRPALPRRDDRRHDHALEPRRARGRSLHRDGQPRREHDCGRRAHCQSGLCRAAAPSPWCQPSPSR